MDFLSRKAGVIALIAVVIAIGGYFFPQTGRSFGSLLDTSFFDIFDATTSYKLAGTTFYSSSGLKLSSVSTALTGVAFGQCVLASDATTIAASTTANIDCGSGVTGKTALGGVASADTVFAFATTTLSSAVFGPVSIDSVHASSTAGFITLQIGNHSGATFTWTNTASSSVRYIDVH